MLPASCLIMGEVCVRVAVRIRPLLPKEVLHNHQVCVRVVPDSAQVMLGSDRTFSFDHAFGPTASQDQFYESCVKPLVASLVDGYNATVFAYGQTGSGKTYTLGGGHVASLVEEQSGIIGQVAADLFVLLGERAADVRSAADVRVSYVELYREELRDLLELHTAHRELHIREDDRGNTVVVGARETVITSAEELQSVLEAGNALRHTGPTQMNERSSRSHAIVTVQLTQHNHDDGSVRSSKLHLVDLAGSERAARTGNTGLRLKESVHINTGLLALGNVIRALSDPHRRGNHVPYRDAKITRLLRDSLGGSAHTLMVACVSPSHHNVTETLSVLQFASRARHVKNQPGLCPARACPGWQPGEARVEELEQEVQTLREALRKRDKTGGGVFMTDSSKQTPQEERDQRGAGLVDELQYYCLAQDAAFILEELQSSTLSPALQHRLQEWLGRHEELSHSCHTDHQHPVGDTGDKPHHNTILQLRRELRKCQDTLAIDEQVFDQREAELQQVQRQVQTLLQEKQRHLQSLQEEREHRRKQSEQLVEQQLLIDRLRGDLLTSRMASSGASLEIGASEKSAKRPHSVPLISQGHCGTRQIHTSPPACSLERVMAAFKTRSQLLLAQIEERDEVICPQREQEEAEEEDQGGSKGFRRSMNRTWTSRPNPACFNQNQTQNTSLNQIQDGLQLPQPSKLPTEREERRVRRSQTVNLQRIQQVETQSRASLQTSGFRDQYRTKVLGTDNMAVFQNGACKDSEEKSERRTWLEQEEERALQRRRGLQELEEELRHREEVLQQREACVQERKQLQIKRLRSSQALSQDLLRVSARLGALDQELEERGGVRRRLSSPAAGLCGVSMEELLKERESLRLRRDTLDTQLRDGRVLTPEEEHALLQLEEALEALDAAVEFKNRSIQERQSELGDTSNPAHEDDDIMRALRELPLPEASALLVKYFNKVVCLRESEQRLQLRCEELELQSGEQEAVTREMEAALQRLTLDTDRRLAEQHQEHQHSIQLLLQQCREGGSGNSGQAVQARLQQLERDLFFYKNSSRELKRKLRELVTKSLPPQALDLQTQGRKGASDGAGDSPSLQTPRVELAPVRLSRRELRQLSPSDPRSTRVRSTMRASRGSFQEDSIEVPRNTY
ncbi:kinesin-like protein KIF27 [Oncorhynchus clarkii lewisi]|uniref:kinesin-like protein KIF27 n=1 Tax=Oncorhynchus clarkii lewisi TaxID=490388 RepID=UPI0039B8B346